MLTAALSSGMAHAQPASAPKDRVTVIGAESAAGSVLVMRSGNVYSLRVGAEVFEGDRVFTRKSGSLRLSFNGCDVALGGLQAIDLTSPFNCEKLAIASLDPDTVLAGASVGAAAVGTAVVAASPFTGTATVTAVFAAIAGTATVASEKSTQGSP
jgi:hypothetical protein